MKQILVVDDNIATLRQISAQLAADYVVSLAKSGELALGICMRSKPDLILLDIEMPNMNGFETLKKIRMVPWLSNIPVIFLTANQDVETEIKGLESGARDFITKPVEKSILIHRIELHLRFSAYQSQLESKVATLSDSVAMSFAELIDCRDEDTGGHVARTSKYVEILGRKLLEDGLFLGEITADDLSLMTRAAPLHDIGKIAISDRILLKPGRLDVAEIDAMQQHAAIGAEILDNMFMRMPSQHYLRYARMIAVSHHERYDGKGYPYGVAGNDIPLCGRIMAIADVYDALTSKRPYKSAFSHLDAMEIILDGKDRRFDPLLVDAFKKIQDEILDIAGLNQAEFDNTNMLG